MAEPTDQPQTAQTLRDLTSAVWLLVIIATLDLGVSLFSTFVRNPAFSPTVAAPIEQTSMMRGAIDRYIDFYKWPIEKKIEAASVIALATHQIADGKVKSIISEILKQEPGIEFYYKVGDELSDHTRDVRKGTTYGDGEIIFFTGSPAQFRFSTTYSHGRIQGLGDMPVERLSTLINAKR